MAANLHLKSLQVFCDVVTRRSFSRAAEDNGMSQSGASQIVHQLEEHLGVKLIDRSKRPFVLTREGNIYFEGCRELIERHAALQEQVKTLHQELSGRVSVASIYSVGLSHMNRLVQQFLTQQPTANVRVEYLHPEKVYEAVEDDRVTMGLVSYPKSSRHIKAIPWRREPMVLVCAPQHPLAAFENAELARLHGADVVGFCPNLQIRRQIDRALAAAHVEVRVVMEFDNIETIKRAIEINAGVALLPEPTVTREVQAGTLVAVPLGGEKLVRPLGIIYRRGKQLGQTAKKFIELLQREAEEAPANAAAATNGSGRKVRSKRAGDAVRRRAVVHCAAG